MSADFDPYAPPKASLEREPAHEYWRDGKVMVMRIGSAGPPRCVKCNDPSVQPVKARTFHWHHPAWYLLVPINVLLYVLVGLLIRKKAKVALGLCARHLRRRRLFISLAVAGLIVGSVIVVAGANRDSSGGAALLGMAVILVSVVAGLIGARTAYPVGITKEEVRFKGCGPEFLESLGEAR